MAASAEEVEAMAEIATSSKVMGPGGWGAMHMAAEDVDENDEDFDHFLYMVDLFARRFKATECREHFADFIKSNPIKRGKASEWTVAAHNAVRKRQGKTLLTVSQARQIWGRDNVRILPCSSSVSSDAAYTARSSSLSDASTSTYRSSSPPPPRGQQSLYYSSSTTPLPNSVTTATLMGPSSLYNSCAMLWNAAKRG